MQNNISEPGLCPRETKKRPIGRPMVYEMPDPNVIPEDHKERQRWMYHYKEKEAIAIAQRIRRTRKRCPWLSEEEIREMAKNPQRNGRPTREEVQRRKTWQEELKKKQEEEEKARKVAEEQRLKEEQERLEKEALVKAALSVIDKLSMEKLVSAMHGALLS